MNKMQGCRSAQSIWLIKHTSYNDANLQTASQKEPQDNIDKRPKKSAIILGQ